MAINTLIWSWLIRCINYCNYLYGRGIFYLCIFWWQKSVSSALLFFFCYWHLETPTRLGFVSFKGLNRSQKTLSSSRWGFWCNKKSWPGALHSQEEANVCSTHCDTESYLILASGCISVFYSYHCYSIQDLLFSKGFYKESNIHAEFCNIALSFFLAFAIANEIVIFLMWWKVYTLNVKSTGMQNFILAVLLQCNFLCDCISTSNAKSLF